MQRREFLSRSALLLAAGLVSGRRLSATTRPAPQGTAFRPIRRGVGTYTARGGTIGWLVNDTGVLAVDSQFPETARDFITGLPGRDDRPLDVLINTHHHPDHTAGNPVLGPAAARHVAHENVPGLQRERAERDMKLDQQVYAKELFANDWRVELGDEVVTARHHGPAHTAGDVIVHFEKANVVHVGDLVFNRVYPVIDRPGGASVDGWMQVLRRLEVDYPADTLFVYGHAHLDEGVVGKRDDIHAFRTFLERMRDLVQSEIVTGKPRIQVIARTGMPGYGDWAPQPERFRTALAAVYDELTGAR